MIFDKIEEYNLKNFQLTLYDHMDAKQVNDVVIENMSDDEQSYDSDIPTDHTERDCAIF